MNGGAPVAHVLSDDRGNYLLRLPRAGWIVTRALRIGASPTVLPAVMVTDRETVTLRFVLTDALSALPNVSVRGAEDCRGRSADGALVGRIWDEARTARLTSQLSSSSELVMAEWTEYRRPFDPSGSTIQQQHLTNSRNHPTLTCYCRSPLPVRTTFTSSRQRRIDRRWSALASHPC